MKTVCIYHSIDLDGWVSAAIVKHWHSKQKESYVKSKVFKEVDVNFGTLDFIGYNYGEPIPDLSQYDKIIMCDISFPVEIFHNLIETKEVIWLDHHKSAINEWISFVGKTGENDLPKGIQDTNYATCELTWQYFFTNETMPEIVRLLGRYDCFGHKTKVFEMTKEGYNKAKQYLTEVGKLQEFENNRTSTDGYSLTHYANTIAEKLSEETKVLEFQYGARQCISNYEEAYEKLMNNIYCNKTIDKENLKDERV